MSDDDLTLAAIVLAIALKRKKRAKLKRKGRIWSKEWEKNHRNPWEGLHKELDFTADNQDFEALIRMSHPTFTDLLSKVAHLITKKNTVMRESIPPQYRLSLTLRFLVSGTSFERMKETTGIASRSVGSIVLETCNAIISELKDYIQLPQTQEDWRKEANDFNDLWNFPNCIGAIDGKHIKILKPHASGNQFLNSMKSFSMVLMAMVNANHEFMMIDISKSGKASDAETQFLSELEENAVNIPNPRKLPGGTELMPYVFIADNAFPLSENIMKPFRQQKCNSEQTIFNCRLARAQKTVENTFGILASRFRILLQIINLSPEKAKTIVSACCYLHNFLLSKDEDAYLGGAFEVEDMETGELCSTDWRNGLQLLPLESNTSESVSDFAEDFRNRLCKYFRTAGSIPGITRKQLK